MSATNCPATGKAGYVSAHEAEKALHRAQHAARRARQSGAKGIRRRERRTYQCPDCGRFHLTSQAAFR